MNIELLIAKTLLYSGVVLMTLYPIVYFLEVKK